MLENSPPPRGVYGIIANPPCTMFSIARGMRAKKPRDLREGMELVEACLKIIWDCLYDLPAGSLTPSLKFWAIENPGTGLLRYFLGKPAFTYQPYEYGHAYTKKTSLWGHFNAPIRPLMISLPPKGRSIKDRFNPMMIRDRRERTDQRSICPPGFAQAFFEANQ